MRSSIRLFVVFLCLVYETTATAEARLTPGAEISNALNVMFLKFDDDYCQIQGSDGECFAPDAHLKAETKGFGIFLQKPVGSHFYYKVFDLDWGLSLPLTYQDFRDQSPSSYVVSTSATGAKTYIKNPVKISMTVFEIQPSLYVQAGLTVPYMPWIFLRLGTGPKVTYGKLKISGENNVTFYTGGHGLYFEALLVLLRTKRVDLTLFMKATGSLFDDRLLVLSGPDHGYRMNNGVFGTGVRIHFK